MEKKYQDTIWIFLILLIFNFSLSGQSFDYAIQKSPESQNTRTVPASAMDDLGSSYIAILYTNVGTNSTDAYLSKVNATGTELWSVFLGQAVTIYEMVYDGTDMIMAGAYENGFTYGGLNLSGTSDFILKFDATGNPIWIQNYTAPDSDNVSLAVDDLGNIYHTNDYTNNGGFWGDCEIIKRNPNGAILHTEQVEDALIGDIAVANDGTIYAAGFMSSSAQFGTINHFDNSANYYSFLVKYNANFDAQWYRHHVDVTFEPYQEIACVDQGVLFLTKEVVSTAPLVFENVIISYDSNGNSIQKKILTEYGFSANYECTTVGDNVAVAFSELDFIDVRLYDKNLQILREDNIIGDVENSDGLNTNYTLSSNNCKAVLSATYTSTTTFNNEFMLTTAANQSEAFVAQLDYTDSCGPSNCAANLNFSGTIPNGLHEASNTISADGMVGSGGNVIFKADCILLDVGFEVSTDAQFLAEIDPCN